MARGSHAAGIIIIIIIIHAEIKVTLSQKCCRDTVQTAMSHTYHTSAVTATVTTGTIMFGRC